MKKLLAVLLVAALGLALGIRSAHKIDATVFAARSRAASGALFLDKNGSRRFICSGTVIGHTDTGDALFLTARHCVYTDGGMTWDGPEPAGVLGPEEVSLTDNEAGPFYTAVPLKISKYDDVAILRLINGGDLPAVGLGDERLTHTGDTLTNYTFALDFGKMPLTLRAVAPVFAHPPAEMLAQLPTWAHSMPVDGTVAPGSSGSGLFDPAQRRLTGVAVGTVQYGGLNIAIPVSRVWALLGDPNGALELPKVGTKPAPSAAPAPPQGGDDEDSSLTIPPDTFKAKFGAAHPFKLTAHGPNPEFTQSGYTFRAQTGGFELDDPYYYDVPVYIALEGTAYRLTSTLHPKGATFAVTVVAVKAA